MTFIFDERENFAYHHQVHTIRCLIVVLSYRMNAWSTEVSH